MLQPSEAQPQAGSLIKLNSSQAVASFKIHATATRQLSLKSQGTGHTDQSSVPPPVAFCSFSPKSSSSLPRHSYWAYLGILFLFLQMSNTTTWQLQNASQTLLHGFLQKVDPHSSPRDWGLGLVTSFRWVGYDRNDGVWLGHERYHGLPLLSLSSVSEGS